MPCPLLYHIYQKCVIAQTSQMFISYSCSGPTQVFLVRRDSDSFWPVALYSLRLVIFIHTASPKKRARRKHSCFLKAVAHIPVARTRPLATLRCQGRREMQSLPFQPLPSTNSTLWDREQGFRWSAVHLCPSFSKYDGWFTDSGSTLSRNCSLPQVSTTSSSLAINHL